jgi:hypothetical protein
MMAMRYEIGSVIRKKRGANEKGTPNSDFDFPIVWPISSDPIPTMIINAANKAINTSKKTIIKIAVLINIKTRQTIF